MVGGLFFSFILFQKPKRRIHCSSSCDVSPISTCHCHTHRKFSYTIENTTDKTKLRYLTPQQIFFLQWEIEFYCWIFIFLSQYLQNISVFIVDGVERRSRKKRLWYYLQIVRGYLDIFGNEFDYGDRVKVFLYWIRK